MTPLAAALVGFVGVLVGVMLRPHAEALYSRRSKTLILILKDDWHKLAAPRDSVLGLAIASRAVDQVIYRSFVLRNRTGRTLRDFQLEFEMRFERGAIDQRAHVEFESSEGAMMLRDEDQSGSRLSVFSVRHCDPDQESAGRILSTHPGTLRCRANNELEVKTIEERIFRVRREQARLALIALLTAGTGLLYVLLTR